MKIKRTSNPVPLSTHSQLLLFDAPAPVEVVKEIKKIEEPDKPIQAPYKIIQEPKKNSHKKTLKNHLPWLLNVFPLMFYVKGNEGLEKYYFSLDIEEDLQRIILTMYILSLSEKQQLEQIEWLTDKYTNSKMIGAYHRRYENIIKPIFEALGFIIEFSWSYCGGKIERLTKKQPLPAWNGIVTDMEVEGIKAFDFQKRTDAKKLSIKYAFYESVWINSNKGECAFCETHGNILTLSTRLNICVECYMHNPKKINSNYTVSKWYSCKETLNIQCKFFTLYITPAQQQFVVNGMSVQAYPSGDQIGTIYTFDFNNCMPCQ